MAVPARADGLCCVARQQGWFGSRVCPRALRQRRDADPPFRALCALPLDVPSKSQARPRRSAFLRTM